MWKWFVASTLVASALCSSGCGRSSPPAVDTTPHVLVQTMFGYTFQFESTASESNKVAGHRKVDGLGSDKETLDEDITITCGPQSARIVNGKLTHSERDCGTVKPGDTIKLISTGKLSVNGVER